MIESSKTTNHDTLDSYEVHQTFDKVMKQVLDLAQSSLPEKQFLAFRKMAMDFFADGRRSLQGFYKGRCGSSKPVAKGAVNMSG